MLQLFKYAIGIALGLTPSILLLTFAPRPSVPLYVLASILAILGVAVGLAYASPHVSSRRINRMLIAMLLSKIVPRSILMDWMNQDDEDEDETTARRLKTPNPANRAKTLKSRFGKGEPPRTLADFEKIHISSIEEHPNQPVSDQQLSQAGLIKNVAPFSLATACGVAADDLLMDVDGRIDGHNVDWPFFYDQDRKMKLRFHSPKTGRNWTVTATGATFGMEIEPTDEAIAESVRDGSAGHEMLEILWSRGEWALLRQAAEPLAADSGSMIQPIGSLYLGVAKCELGYPSGAELLEEFGRNHLRDYTVNFAAICHAHLGAFLCIKGDKDRGTQLLERAAMTYSHPRILDMVERFTGSRPPEDDEVDPLVGTNFDLEFTLPSADQGGSRVTLSEAISQLSDTQVLPFCLLGDYRSNGPYRAFLLRYRRAAIFFPHYFAPPIVVTKSRDAPHPPSLAIENEFHEDGVPLLVQWDHTGEVHEAIPSAGSPHILFINKDRRVVACNFLDEGEMWDIIEKQSRS